MGTDGLLLGSEGALLVANLADYRDEVAMLFSPATGPRLLPSLGALRSLIFKVSAPLGKFLFRGGDLLQASAQFIHRSEIRGVFVAVVGRNVGLLDGTLVSRGERSASSPGGDGLLVGSTGLEHVANQLPPSIAMLACSL